MKFIFFSTGFDTKSINNKILKKINFVQQRFDFSILKDFSENKFNNIYAVSYPPEPSFPKCNEFYLKKRTLHLSFQNIVLPTLNVPIFKQTLLFFFSFIEFLRWNLLNRKEKRSVLFFSLNPINLFLNLIINRFFKIDTFVIVPDIPIFTHKRRIFLNFVYRIFFSLKDFFTGYVLLSHTMTKFFPKNYIVLNNFVDFSLLKKESNSSIYNKKTISYAGNLDYNSGILEFIDCFLGSNFALDFEMYIFGSGSAVPKIMNLMKISNRIHYFGLLDNEEVFEYLMKSKFLINPRPTNLNYSIYSFPSKLFYYLSSGIPTISTISSSYDDIIKEWLIPIDLSSKEIGVGLLNKIYLSSYVKFYKKAQKVKIKIKKNYNVNEFNKKLYEFISRKKTK